MAGALGIWNGMGKPQANTGWIPAFAGTTGSGALGMPGLFKDIGFGGRPGEAGFTNSDAWDPQYQNIEAQHEPMSEEEVAIWRRRLMRSHRSKREHGLIERWRVLNDYYENRYFTRLSKEHQVAVNWMFAQIRSAVASLYYENPTFFCTGLSEEGRQAAPVVEQVMTIERRAMRADVQEERFLLHGLKYGIGILKHGYQANPGVRDRGMAGPEFKDEPRGPFAESDYRMRYGHPWKIAVQPWHLLMDPDAEKPELARWFCHRYYRPFVDVKEDSRFDAAARKELSTTGKTSSYSDSDAEGLSDATRSAVRDDASMVTLYEIFDVARKRVIVLSDHGTMALLNKRYDQFGDMTPYEFLVFYEAEENPWGIAWAETFRSQVEVINIIRSQMLEHLESWGRTRVLYLKNMGFSEDDIIRALKSRGASAIGVTNSNGQKLSEILDVLPRIEISADSWRLGESYHRDMVDVSGSSELGRQTTETATEAVKLDEKQGLRIGHMRKRWDAALEGSAQRDLKSLQRWWGPERVIPLLGPDGQLWQLMRVPFWMMNSEYLLSMQPGSTERIDKAVRTRQIIDAMDRLERWMQWIQAQGYQLNVIELVKSFLRQTEVFRNPERLFMAVSPQGQLPAPNGAGGAPGGMLPGATAVSGLGGMPQLQGAGLSGRTLSEMFGGGAFGGGFT